VVKAKATTLKAKAKADILWLQAKAMPNITEANYFTVVKVSSILTKT